MIIKQACEDELAEEVIETTRDVERMRNATRIENDEESARRQTHAKTKARRK